MSRKVFFSKKKHDMFSDILIEDVNLMLHKDLEVSRQYLRPFLSYRENPGGRQNLPGSGSRVTTQVAFSR